MKKILSLLLVVVLVISLTACSSGDKNIPSGNNSTSTSPSESEATADTKTLTIGHYIDPANTEDAITVAMTKLYDELSERTGINIVIETIPWDQIEGKMVMTNQAGNPSADIYIISSQKLASIVNSGAVMALDDFIERDFDKSSFVPSAFEAGTYSGDGKIYCMLSSVHTRGLWYNKSLIPEAPKTRDEFLAAAKAATDIENNIYGFGFWGNHHYGSMEVAVAPLMWDVGVELCDSEGKATWATKETADTIRFLSDAINVDKIAPQTCITMVDSVEIFDLFYSGNIASYISGTYDIARIQESDLFKEGNIGFAPIPGVDGPAPCFSNSWAFAIPSNSKQPDLAWEFIKAFSEPEIQAKHAAFEGGMPTRIECYEDEMFSNGIYKEFYENMANGRGMDPFVYYQEGLEAISLAKTTYIMDPTQDLDALLLEAQEDFNNRYYPQK